MAVRPSKSPEDMKAIAAMLVCPHRWGAERNVRVIDKGKPRDGQQSTCEVCGTHRVKWGDGTACLVPADGLSSEKP